MSHSKMLIPKKSLVMKKVLMKMTRCQELVDAFEASECNHSMVQSIGLGLRH